MFGPVAFPLFAVLHLVFAVVALDAWSAAPVAAAGLFVVECITCFDNAVVAVGNRIGIGNLLYRLNRLRFFLHAVLIGCLIPVYAGIGKLAGVGLFSSAGFETAIALLTLGVIAFGYLVGYRNVRPIMPVNYHGCLRYAQSVTVSSRREDYDYSAAELEQKSFPPLTSILTVTIGLVLSLWIGVSTNVWIPAIVTGLMMLAGRLPANATGAFVTSCLEIGFSAGILWSLVSLAGQ